MFYAGSSFFYLYLQVCDFINSERTVRLHLYSGKFILAAMYLRRVGINGSSYAATPTQVSPVVAPPVPAAQISACKKAGGEGGRGGGKDAAAAGDKQLGSCAAVKVKTSLV
jgi:hypothetical protein